MTVLIGQYVIGGSSSMVIYTDGTSNILLQCVLETIYNIYIKIDSTLLYGGLIKFCFPSMSSSL